MAVVHKWADAFNKGTVKLAHQLRRRRVDHRRLAPHVWQGSGACASWYKDYEAFTAKAQITAASVAIGKTHQLDIDSGYAYLVTPTTLTFTKAGKQSRTTPLSR
jgi:hypothetical protein